MFSRENGGTQSAIISKSACRQARQDDVVKTVVFSCQDWKTVKNDENQALGVPFLTVFDRPVDKEGVSRTGCQKQCVKHL